MNASASKPDRTLIVIVSGIALLVIVALANVSPEGSPGIWTRRPLRALSSATARPWASRRSACCWLSERIMVRGQR